MPLKRSAINAHRIRSTTALWRSLVSLFEGSPPRGLRKASRVGVVMQPEALWKLGCELSRHEQAWLDRVGHGRGCAREHGDGRVEVLGRNHDVEIVRCESSGSAARLA